MTQFLSSPRMPIVPFLPVTAAQGDLVCLSSDGLLYVYTGTQWVLCAGASATNPLTILGAGNVALWLRSDLGITLGTGTEVAGWADQGANANDASEATASERPLLTSSLVVADGTDDRLIVADAASIDITNYATIAFRVRPDTLAGSRAWVAKSASTGGSWSIQYSGEMRFWCGTPGVNGGAVPSGLFGAGTLVTVVIVYDKDGGSNADRLKFWVDGAPQTVSFYGTIPSGGLTATADDLWLFAYNNGLQFAQGAMKELVIASVAADATQVADLSDLLTNGPPAVQSGGSSYDAARRQLLLG